MSKKILTICAILSALWFIFAYLLIEYLIVERHLATADVVVILSGSAEYRKRTKAAAELLKNGNVSRVILTNDGQRGGWDPIEQRNPFFVELAVRSLKDEGVDIKDIEVLPGVVGSTYDEGEAVLSAAAQRGYGSIILVTSGYHTRRALWTFERSAERRRLPVNLGVESPEDDRQMSAKLSWWLSRARLRTIGAELPKFIYYRQVY